MFVDYANEFAHAVEAHARYATRDGSRRRRLRIGFICHTLRRAVFGNDQEEAQADAR